MRAAAAAAFVLVTGFGPCTRVSKPEVPAPPPPRVDTVTVTKEVPPPLPEGTPAIVCLSTGFPMQVLVSAAGDTLVGEKRIALKDLRPGLVFEGTYAAGKDWLRKGEFTFEKRVYKRAGEPAALKCDDLKDIGEFDGVHLFADLAAPSPVETIFVPVTPGLYQPFRTQLTRRR